MKTVERLAPTHRAGDGTPIRVLGSPFRVNHQPPGVTWVAGLCADGKLRPFDAERVVPLERR